MPAPHQLTAAAGAELTATEAAALIARAAPAADCRDQRVLLIIPDGTRTAPIGLMFKALHAQLAPVVKKFDVMIALGTHPAMSDEAINARVEITAAERTSAYRDVEFINHEWDNPAALRDLGVIVVFQPIQIRDAIVLPGFPQNLADPCLLVLRCAS